MTAFFIVLGVLLVLVIAGMIAASLFTAPIARRLYFSQWTRPEGAHRERHCTDPDIPYHFDMYKKGMAWRDANKDKLSELSLERDGLKLCAEYYDFGFHKAAIILPGRREDATYSAFYAAPLVKAGYNVLCPDQRVNGLSDGTYITLGKEEHKDALAWGGLLHEEHGVEEIVIDGICTGASTGLILMESPQKPAYFTRLIIDGAYYSFFEVYRRHIMEKKKPVFPVILQVIACFRRHAKVHPGRLAAKRYVRNLTCPVLFLSGIRDIYALPKYAWRLFRRCPAEEKRLVILDGRHSHLRYDDRAAYDAAVGAFLS